MTGEDCVQSSKGEPLRLGNQLFAKGDFVGAIAAYTKAILFTGQGDPERAQAFSSRSAVLMTVGHFRDALCDAERALENGFPEVMRFRLHLRMAICFRELGEMEKAREQLSKSKELTGRYDLPEEKKSEMISLVDKNFSGAYEVKIPFVSIEYLPPPDLSYGANSDLPAFSAAVKVERDDYFGRKIIATRDLKTGDVILVEDPVVSNLKNDAHWLNCSQCYKLSYCLAPCEKCKTVLFCSSECQNQAAQHDLVCTALKRYQELKNHLNLSENMSANLSRIFDFISTFGVEELLSFRDDVGSNSLLAKVLGLCYHLPEQETQIRTLCSVIISHCFQLSDPDGVSRLSELSCRMLLIDKANSFSLEQCFLHAKGREMEVRHVAYGTYPCASYMNHSCDPNVVSTYHLKTMVMRVARPVAKGEQLFNRYCNSFYNMPRDMRRTRLQNYSFACGCEACVCDWPVAKLLPDEPLFEEARTLADRVKTLLAQCRCDDGTGVNLDQVRDEDTFALCLRTQNVYFEPQKRSRLDKLYRTVELLMYYFFCSKTTNFVVH